VPSLDHADAMTKMQAKTDHQIQSAIVKELDWSPGVEAEHVGVAVTEGAVTLSGEVATLPERDAAVKAAMRIHCVSALVDEIVVKRQDGSHNDADVARAANAVLGHLVQLSGAPISATVHDQVVTLSGTVDWHYQREAARRAVESLGGVVDVLSDVAVRPTPVQSDAEDRIRDALLRGARRDARHVAVSVDGHLATLRGHVYSWKERREAELAAFSARGITDVHNELVVVP
jgi:osmotically-inducible protein OsmY